MAYQNLSILRISFFIHYSIYSWPIKQFFCVYIPPPPIVFKNISTIPSVTRKTRLIQALAIPTDVQMTVVYLKRETALPATDKTSKALLV